MSTINPNQIPNPGEILYDAPLSATNLLDKINKAINIIKKQTAKMLINIFPTISYLNFNTPKFCRTIKIVFKIIRIDKIKAIIANT